MALEVFDYISIFCLSVVVIVLFPAIIYHYVYRKVWLPHSSLRYSSYFSIGMCILICALIERLIYTLCYIISFVNVNTILSQILTPLIWSIFVYIYILKYYFMHYKANYVWESEHNSWKIIINRDYKKNEANFYLRHGLSYGNIRWMIRVTLLPLICFIFVLILFNIFLTLYQFIFDLISLLIIIFIFKYISKTINKVIPDKHNTYKEIKLQLKFIIIISSIKLIVSSLFFILYSINFNDNTNINKLESLLCFWLGVTVIYRISYISTIKVIKLQKYSEKRNTEYEQYILRHFHRNRSHSLEDLWNNPPEQNPLRFKQYFPATFSINSDMVDTLQNKLGTYLFMSHVTKEYSSENMLFLFELAQIKYNYYLKQNKIFKCYKWSKTGKQTQIVVDFSSIDLLQHKYIMFIHADDWVVDRDDLYKQNWIQICNDIPITTMINDNERDLNINGCVYDQMKLLYNKYIKMNSNYEINSPFWVKNALSDIFDGKINIHNTNDDSFYINVMDHATKELVNILLPDGYKRFTASKEYLLYKDQVKPLFLRNNVEFHENMEMYTKLIDQHFAIAITKLKEILGEYLFIIVIQFLYEDYAVV